MPIKQLDWWYDRQQPRFLEQIIRAFSGFQYMTGQREVNGRVIAPQLKIVPCTLAMTDRVVGHIMRNNSENTALSTPRITVAHTGLAGRRDDVQFLSHVDSRSVVERDIDPETGKYSDAAGRPNRSYTVERMMPRPFEMTINVDIWTSNQDQKYQLMEQILTVVYPDFQIQNSENALDWSALTMMELTDINWSSRSIPVGTESEIDVATLTFRVPFLLSPPVKVTQQRIIEQIIANVYDGRADETPTEEKMMFQQIVTPGDHILHVEQGVMRLLGSDGADLSAEGKSFHWKDLLDLYGKIRPGLSTIHLKMHQEQIDDWSHDIVGTIQLDQSNPDLLLWQVDPDTVPPNTLSPIDAVIDPQRTIPGSNGLPGNANGQRYIVLKDILGPNAGWGNLTAKPNDIIEYNAGQWKVAYSPVRFHEQPQHPEAARSAFLLNLKSGNQLRWNGQDWVKTLDGIYEPGYWRIRI